LAPASLRKQIIMILKIDKLWKDFSGLEVLSEITMEIFEGERHAIIGPNGAGKTTLFNIITGFYRPSKGKIYFLDKDITGLSAHKIARLGLSRSFQIINVFPKMTVYENVRSAVVSKFNRRYCCTALLNRDRKIERESDRIIGLLRMTDVRNVPASELSYGRQRQLELALTVARDPVLIMLDEPTAGLSSEETRKAVPFIKQVADGKTLVIVEHDMNVVFNLADRITVLNDGKILATGTPDEIRENIEVKNAYLGRR
jgi:branched-chain amino acid transport system ATP-binding protein